MNYCHHEGTYLAYKSYGNGNKTLLLFHGFGQDASAFEDLCRVLEGSYRCYCFDLFFHGNSKLSALHNPLNKHLIKDLFEKFLQENDIHSFSVMGFSLGSKLALSCLEIFSEKVKEVYLLAPDSIRPDIWYRLATNNFAGRSIFKMITTHSKYWIAVLSVAASLGLVRGSLKTFAASQMRTDSQRLKVYNTWMAFRLLFFDFKSVCKIVSDHKIDLTVFVGKNDLVVPAKRVKRLKRYLPNFEPVILECGHTNMIKAAADFFDEAKK